MSEPMFGDRGARPLVVGAVGNDEFQFVALPQVLDVLPAVLRDLAGAGRLQVDDARDTRVDRGNVERARGFERDVATGVAQRAEQREAAGLRQRLAAGDADACSDRNISSMRSFFGGNTLAPVVGVAGTGQFCLSRCVALSAAGVPG